MILYLKKSNSGFNNCAQASCCVGAICKIGWKKLLLANIHLGKKKHYNMLSKPNDKFCHKNTIKILIYSFRRCGFYVIWGCIDQPEIHRGKQLWRDNSNILDFYFFWEQFIGYRQLFDQLYGKIFFSSDWTDELMAHTGPRTNWNAAVLKQLL